MSFGVCEFLSLCVFELMSFRVCEFLSLRVCEFVSFGIDVFGSCWLFVSLKANALTCTALPSIYRNVKCQDDFAQRNGPATNS